MQYQNPPIAEAILEIRFTPAHDEAVDCVKLHEKVKDTYPTKQILRLITGEFHAGELFSTSMKEAKGGCAFKSSDGLQTWQAKPGSFLFGRQAPYERWQFFRDEARRLWQVFKQIAEPREITRAAIRTVNRLDLPLPLRDLKDYLRTLPEVSSDLPQGLAAFFMQLQIPQDELQSSLIINQTIVPPPKPGVASILLDIDLYRDHDLPQDEDAMWSFFEQLHSKKNAIFEACITDEARKLFQ